MVTMPTETETICKELIEHVLFCLQTVLVLPELFAFTHLSSNRIYQVQLKRYAVTFAVWRSKTLLFKAEHWRWINWISIYRYWGFIGFDANWFLLLSLPIWYILCYLLGYVPYLRWQLLAIILSLAEITDLRNGAMQSNEQGNNEFVDGHFWLC